MKKYPIVDPGSKNVGYIAANPKEKIATSDAMLSLSAMLAHASSRSKLPDGEFSLLSIALKRNQVTVDEVMEAFWKAYEDPYVPQGRIEFRHLWKYIEEKRGTKEKQYTYHGMLREMDKTGLPMDAFEIMDGDKGRPKVIDSQGKPMWRLCK